MRLVTQEFGGGTSRVRTQAPGEGCGPLGTVTSKVVIANVLESEETDFKIGLLLLAGGMDKQINFTKP